MTTFGAALADARLELKEAGCVSPGLDARVLLAAAAGLDMAALIARERDAMPPLAQEMFRSHLHRRLQGEPVARILGEREFWGLSFEVDASTLVPRPETETLVAAALGEAQRRPERKLRICDLGTGSGAILVSLLTELPEAKGVGVDLSQAAITVARRNARRMGVSQRTEFTNGDYALEPKGQFDLVVANPPYVRSDVIHTLERDVRDYDPILALDGGPDGLAAYRVIARRAGSLLAPGGFLAVEVGYDQAEAVAEILGGSGLGELAVVADLAGVARVVTGVHRPGSSLLRGKKALGKVETPV